MTPTLMKRSRNQTDLRQQQSTTIYSHSFDAGAAWGSLALQAQILGYHAHGMTGVHFEKAYEAFGIAQEEFRIEAAVAFGKAGDPNQLPEGLREREVPSSRMPLSDIAFNGKFPS